MTKNTCHGALHTTATELLELFMLYGENIFSPAFKRFVDNGDVTVRTVWSEETMIRAAFFCETRPVQYGKRKLYVGEYPVQNMNDMLQYLERLYNSYPRAFSGFMRTRDKSFFKLVSFVLNDDDFELRAMRTSRFARKLVVLPRNTGSET